MLNELPKQIYTSDYPDFSDVPGHPDYPGGMLRLPSESAVGMDVSQLIIERDTQKHTSSLLGLQSQRLIRGLIVIQRALNEGDINGISNIDAYDLYWGSDEVTRLPNTQRIYSWQTCTHKLEYKFARGTRVPYLATHLLLYSRNIFGRRRPPLAQALGDWWVQGVSMPTARALLSGAYDGRYLYVAGGRQSDNELKIVEVFNPNGVRENDQAIQYWSSGPDLPKAISGGAHGVVHDSFYLTGGQSYNETFQLIANDQGPASVVWQTLSESPLAKFGAASAIADNQLFVLGGGEGATTASKSVEVFSPLLGGENGTWSLSPSPLTLGRRFATACTAGGEIYLLGGTDEEGNYLSSVECYNVRNQVWRDIASMSVPRSGAMCGVFGRYIYVFGGEHKAVDGVLSSVEKLDLFENTWREKTPMPTARKNGLLALINGCFYIVGGEDIHGNALSTMEIYIPD